MIDKLAGYKTYIFTVLAIVWAALYLKIPGAKEALGPDNFQLVFVALLGMAGISLKAGQTRLEGKVADMHEDVKDAAKP